MGPADCHLEHVFDIEVLFGADRTIFGPLPSGSSQGYTPAIGVSEPCFFKFFNLLSFPPCFHLSTRNP